MCAGRDCVNETKLFPVFRPRRLLSVSAISRPTTFPTNLVYLRKIRTSFLFLFSAFVHNHYSTLSSINCLKIFFRSNNSQLPCWWRQHVLSFYFESEIGQPQTFVDFFCHVWSQLCKRKKNAKSQTAQEKFLKKLTAVPCCSGKKVDVLLFPRQKGNSSKQPLQFSPDSRINMT